MIQRLGDTTITAEFKYPINFKESGKRFVISLHYSGSNSLLVNAVKMCQFKAKDSEMKPYPLCFTINDIKKTKLKGSVRVFSVDYDTIDTYNILDIYTYLFKEA